MSQATIPVAVYMRVSSDDQRDRETILTQKDTIERWLRYNPQYEVVGWFDDDGVSGTIHLNERPKGHHLVALARSGRIKGVVVTRGSRLGRDEVDLLLVYRLLKELGVALIGVSEPLDDETMFGFNAIMNGAYRRQFLADSARGMDRAARAGRYTGGIVPLGFKAEGHKHTARLVADEEPYWADLSAAELVRRIYHWLGVDGHSCRWVANELNLLGVPTTYQRDGRGVRGERVAGVWRSGRVRNLLVNPVYKGRLEYGRRRSKASKRSEVIAANIDGLVSEQLWEAAQRALADNRIAPKNSPRHYLLRSVIYCGICGLRYCGMPGRPGLAWYRCNGKIFERGPVAGKCPGKAIRSDWLEPLVWADIEAWLRNPGDLLEKIDAEQERDNQQATAEAERITLEKALEGLQNKRKTALSLHLSNRITEAELDEMLAEIDADRRQVEERLKLLYTPDEEEAPTISTDLLTELRQRLDAGLDDRQKGEIVRLLVKRIVVHTEEVEGGRKRIRLQIEYRFPASWCGLTRTGMDSWPPHHGMSSGVRGIP